ncbi:MAG: hypothetical protein M1839_006302 [Geoglossum umbratile]|nr:MAG: hypothetical protein M1839_006302 [Geoglossum umbratile]
MASSFPSTPPPQPTTISGDSTSPAAEIHCMPNNLSPGIEALQQITPTIRIMASGRCTVTSGADTLGVECPTATSPPRTTFVPSPADSLREDTVAALWERLQQVQVIHVRGTPASGKSTLAGLLGQHVRTVEPGLQVYATSWPAIIPERIWKYDQLLNYITNQSPDKDDWWTMKVLIIIDEAQGSYRYSSLWNNFIKGISYGSGIMVALFSSYGSPSNRPLESLAPTPIIFAPNSGSPSVVPSRTLISLRSEFDDAVNRFCETCGQHGQAFLPPPKLVDYIWEITNGYPSGVRAILEGLAFSKHLRPYRKASSEIPLDAALDLFKDSKFIFGVANHSAFNRGIPPAHILQDNPKIARLLRKILAFNQSDDKWQTNPALELCYRQGWLQAELSNDEPQDLGDPKPKVVYVFSSKLHQRCVEHLLSDSVPPFPLEKFPSVKDLCLAVIRNFKSSGLRSGGQVLGPGAQLRPLEVQYQDEFYRACYTLLDTIYLSSEWAGKEPGGPVDFRVKSLGWAIECVREGHDLKEHIARFLPGGGYYEWVESGEIKQHILLDFRTSMPGKTRDIPWLYSIVFSNDFTGYKVYDAGLEQVEEGVALLG